MSRIRGKNTKPELQVRRICHGMGLRFRLYRKDLPGKPDLVFPKYRTAVFVNGCFWHGHDCHLFKVPGTRKEFWTEKIAGTRARDAYQLGQLQELGWRTVVVWECALKGRTSLDIESLCHELREAVLGDRPRMDIEGLKCEP